MLARERLVHCLDVALFCHLLAVYTLDETLWRAVVATLAHLDMQRPQPAKFRPLVAVFVTQLVAILSHLWGPLPSATSDGYLHGTIVTNFIGVLPSSRSRLVILDLVVAALELAMFTCACDPNRERVSSLDILDPTDALRATHCLDVDSLGLSAFNLDTPQNSPTRTAESAEEGLPQPLQSIWDYL